MTAEPLPYDLKPLTGFVESPLRWWWLLGLLVVALLLFLAHRVKRAAPIPAQTLDFSLLEELRRLEQLVRSRAVPVEELASQLSLCVRTLIELKTKLPATDLTVAELECGLRRALDNGFSLAKPSSISKVETKALSLLKELEHLSFGTPTGEGERLLLRALAESKDLALSFDQLTMEHDTNKPIIPVEHAAADHLAADHSTTPHRAPHAER